MTLLQRLLNTNTTAAALLRGFPGTWEQPLSEAAPEMVLKEGATQLRMSSTELATWLLATDSHDSVGRLDAHAARWIARKAREWRLVRLYVGDREFSLPPPGAPLSQPIVAKWNQREGEWDILDGQHRISKAVDAGLEQLPAYVPEQDVEHEDVEIMGGLEEGVNQLLDILLERESKHAFGASIFLNPANAAKTYGEVLDEFRESGGTGLRTGAANQTVTHLEYELNELANQVLDECVGQIFVM